MTIKEIEEATGLSRASVRYYETEGLLSPERSSNGYREYTAEDFETLRRIHLLRLLGFSLEDIRSFQKGDTELAESLEQRVMLLKEQKSGLGRAGEVCREMSRDGVSFVMLDAGKYLDALNSDAPEEQAREKKEQTPSITVMHRSAPAVEPWRRFLARSADFAICRCIWFIFSALLLKHNPINNPYKDLLFGSCTVLLLTLFLEPLFLSMFGATPGKMIMGLRVRSMAGDRKLSYEEAFSRTKSVLHDGCGLLVPGYRLFCMNKSRETAASGEALQWEEGSLIELKDRRKWRVPVLIGVLVLAVGAMAAAELQAERPVNQGELTISGFAENYEYVCGYGGYESAWHLNSQAQWEETSPLSSYDLDISPEGPPELRLTVSEDGTVTEVSFEQTVTGAAQPPSYAGMRQILMVSFIGADRASGFLMRDIRSAAGAISERPYESTVLDVCGYSVETEFISDGLVPSEDYKHLLPSGGADTEDASCIIRFSISR